MIAPPMFSMGTSQRGIRIFGLHTIILGDLGKHDTKYITPGPGTYPIKVDNTVKPTYPNWV